MKKITVTIRKEQKEWLEEHPNTNASGLLQEAIDLRILNMTRCVKRVKKEREKE